MARYITSYKFQVDLQFKKDNQSKPKQIRPEFIKYIVIESLYTERMMPVVYLSMIVDSQTYTDIYDSQNKKLTGELTESIFLLKIRRYNKLAQAALFQTAVDDQFEFIVSDETPNYSKELEKADTSGTSSYREITLALLSVSLLNAIRAERNPDNSVIVSGIFNKIDMNTLIAKVFEGIDNYFTSSKDQASVIKPAVHNVTFKKHSLVIPPMNSRKKILNFLFNKAPFYDTQFTFFIDFGRAYLLDRTKGGYKVDDNTYHDVIFEIHDATKDESYVEGINIRDNSYFIYINPVNSSITPNRDHDKIANTIVSVTDNGTISDATINSNNSDKSDTKYVFSRGTNALLYKNNKESKTVTVVLGKENLDGGIFTPNKRYRLKNYGDYTRYDGFYYLQSKKEVIANNAGEFKGSVEFTLQKIGKISNIGDTNEDGEVENAEAYDDVGSAIANRYFGTKSSSSGSRHSQTTNKNQSDKKSKSSKNTMVSVKKKDSKKSGSGLGSDSINEYKNGTLVGAPLKTKPVNLGDLPGLSVEEQIRIVEENRVERLHGNEVSDRSSGPVKVVRYNQGVSITNPI